MDRTIGIAGISVLLFAVSACARPAASITGGPVDSASACPASPAVTQSPVLSSPTVTTAGVEPPTPHPVITVPPGESQVTLTRAANESNVVMHSGQRVNVTLCSGHGRQWSLPSTSNQRVMRRVWTSTAAGGGAQAAFLATVRGTANLSAKWTCSFPGCKSVSIGWQVSVLVE
jgi:hypothetical protein